MHSSFIWMDLSKHCIYSVQVTVGQHTGGKGVKCIVVFGMMHIETLLFSCVI